MATSSNTNTSSSNKKRLSAGLRAEHDDAELPRRKSRRWFTKLFLSLLILVGVAPYIIAYTPLRDTAVRWAMKDQLNGSLTIGGLSLGWLSPIAVDDITLLDAAGQPVAKVAHVETSLRLWQFVSNPTDLGTIKVVNPAISLAADNTMTNLEQVLAPLLKPTDEPSKPRDIRIEVVEGSLSIRDLVTNKTWNIDQLNVALTQKHDLPLPTDWSAGGRVKLENRVATFRVGSDAAVAAAQAGQSITLQTDAIPLEMFRWAVARGLGEIELTGFLRSSGVLVNRTENGVALQDFRGELAIDQLYVGGKALGGDQVQLASIRVPCDLTASPDAIDIRSLRVECDMAQLSAQGKLPLKSTPGKDDAFALLRESLILKGTVNLPMLTQQLHNTLGITPGTQLTSGQVIANWNSHHDANGTAWKGSLSMDNIAAINNGQRIALSTPIAVEVDARDTASGPIIERVMASSKFLNITGTGNLDQLTIKGTCNLDDMAQELGQLIDLSTLKPAGKANLDLVWSKAANGSFSAKLNTILEQFSLTLPGNLTMREPRLTINATAAGSVNSGMTRLDSGELVVEAPPTAGTSQTDRLSVVLKQPITLSTGSGASWTTALLTTNLPLELRLQGELAAWQPRLATFLPLSGYRMAGVADIAAAGQFSSTRMQLASLSGKIQPAQFVGAGMFINEATLQLEGSADVDLTAQRLNVPQLTIQSATVAAQLTETELLWPAKGMTARGKARYQADLGRLQQWTVNPEKPELSYRTIGMLIGDCTIATGGTTTQVTMNNTIQNLAIYDYAALVKANGQNVAPLWHEAELKLNLRGAMNSTTDIISAESLELQSQAIALRTAGKLNGLNGAKPTVELAGKIDYDWNTLAPLVSSYTSGKVTVKGRQSSDFTLAGPLDMTAEPSKVASNVTMVSRPSAPPVTDSFAMIKPVSATASVGWEELVAAGIPLQRGQMDLQLRDGMLGFQKPFVIQANEGKITLAPSVRLTPGPMEILIPNGPVVEQFKMTKEMARDYIKYVAPMLADATSVEGRFSVSVTEGRIPVDQWQRMTVSGKAMMHGMEVMPGPKSELWVNIARQVKGVVSGGGLAALAGGAGGDGSTTSMVGTGLSAAGSLLNGGGIGGLANGLGGATGATGGDQKTVLLRMPEQTIDYAVQDGKVYHQGLTMEIDNLVVRTRGWVGLDNTLGLVLEVPLRDEWIQKYPTLAQLPNKAIALNVGGTVDKPSINSAELRQLVMSMGQSVLQDKVLGGVQDKLGGGVDGLQQKAGDQINGYQQKAEEKLNGFQQKLDGQLNKQFDKLFGK